MSNIIFKPIDFQNNPLFKNSLFQLILYNSWVSACISEQIEEQASNQFVNRIRWRNFLEWK